MGIWRLELVIHTPVNGEGAILDSCRRRDRERPWWWSNKLLTSTSHACRAATDVKGPGKTRGAIHGLDTRGVVHLSGETKRPLRVESIYDAFAEVVIVDTPTSSDRGF